MIIELQDLSCSFTSSFPHKIFTAISPLNVVFEQGGRYAIVGESGSGKTTLARMIAGIQRPSSGNVYIDGKEVYKRKRTNRDYFRKVQIIQQNSLSALNPRMSIGSSIEEPMACFLKLDKAARRRKCEEFMQLCNLPLGYYKKLPHELSGGEQKRVAIARALVIEPDCLIFDEATNGFDLPLREKIMDEIDKLQRKIGFTSIFITHDIELALIAADKILVMKESKVLEEVEFSGEISVFQHDYSKVLLAASGII